MSKIIEQASLTAGQPAGRVGQVIPSKDEKNQNEPAFGFKEIALLIGVVAIIVGIVGYGVYSQRSRVGTEVPITTIIEPTTVPQLDQAPALTGSIAQPVQVAHATPALTVQPSKSPESAPPQTESRHADVYFDFGKSRLRADATAILQQHAQMLKQDGNWAVLIQGYADQHGPTEYNKNLALRRADSVKQFLVELGVPESSMKVVTLGKESSICDNQSRSCQRLNRRVHVEMVKLESQALPEGASLLPAPGITQAESVASPVETTDSSDLARVVDLPPPFESPASQESIITPTD